MGSLWIFFKKFETKTDRFLESKNPTMVTTLLETIVFNNKIGIEQEHVFCPHHPSCMIGIQQKHVLCPHTIHLARCTTRSVHFCHLYKLYPPLLSTIFCVYKISHHYVWKENMTHHDLYKKTLLPLKFKTWSKFRTWSKGLSITFLKKVSIVASKHFVNCN